MLHLFLVNLFLYLENKFLKDLYTNGVNVFNWCIWLSVYLAFYFKISNSLLVGAIFLSNCFIIIYLKYRYVSRCKMDKARLEMFLNKLQNYSISGISNSASYDFFVNERCFYSFFFLQLSWSFFYYFVRLLLVLECCSPVVDQTTALMYLIVRLRCLFCLHSYVFVIRVLIR